MQKHLILSLLLAFAIAVACAPTKSNKVATSHAQCKLRKPSSKAAGANPGKSASRTTTNAHKPVAGAISNSRKPAGGPTRTKPSSSRHALSRRAPVIQLCGMALRSTSTTGCSMHKAFVYDKGTKKWEWKDGQSSGLQCDHVLELQMIKAALEGAGFCNAWNGMVAVAQREGHVTLSKPDLTNVFAPLKAAANDYEGQFYIDPQFNNEKRTFFTDIISVRHALKHHLSIGNPMYAYMAGPGVTQAGTSVATKVEAAAIRVLANLYTEATKSFKSGATEDDKDGYACDLTIEQAKYAKGTPVTTYWNYVVNSM